MREIGVRELKSSLSETLRGVEGGERVRITSHGRPIADIVPSQLDPEEERLKRLIAGGRITPSSKKGPIIAPEPEGDGVSSAASDLIVRDRDE